MKGGDKPRRYVVTGSCDQKEDKMAKPLFDLTGKVAIITGASRGGVKQLTMYITGQTILVDGGITTGSTRAIPAQKA